MVDSLGSSANFNIIGVLYSLVIIYFGEAVLRPLSCCARAGGNRLPPLLHLIYATVVALAQRRVGNDYGDDDE